MRKNMTNWSPGATPRDCSASALSPGCAPLPWNTTSHPIKIIQQVGDIKSLLRAIQKIEKP